MTNSAHFRAPPLSRRTTARVVLADVFTMSKSSRKSTAYPDSSDPRQMRVTEPLESARRNRRLAAIRVDRFALMTNGTTYDKFDHTTVARLSIFANVLPMLSTANSVLSAGPTSISRTWSSPVFTSSRSRVSSSARRRRENRECVRVRAAYRRSPTARGDGVRIGGPFRAWADGWVSLVVQKTASSKNAASASAQSGAAHIKAARVKFRYWPTEIFRVRNTPTTFNLSNMDMLGSSSANSGWASRA